MPDGPTALSKGRLVGSTTPVRLWACCAAASALALPAAADPLRDGFADPPAAARPFVWWHWMNGNVSAEGAVADLAWMKRIGIGGVQMLEGDLATPVVVDHRLVWMSPAWKAALRTAVRTADRLGLDFAIASSPGWSISGAPFVAPADAMKKLVWAETRVAGGVPVGRLALPPAVAGPYQDIAGDRAATLAPYYRDAALVAFPDTSLPPLRPVRVSADGGRIDGAALGDGRYAPAIDLPFPGRRAEATVTYDYGRPVTVRSVVLGLPGARGFGAPPAPVAQLEGSDDGRRYRAIATLPAATAQVWSAAFAPVTLRYARIRLVADAASLPPLAAGVIAPVLGPPPPRSFALSEFVLSSDGRVHRAEEKAGFAAADDYGALPTPAASVAHAVDPATVIDLTARLRSDGSVDWTPPPGRWTLLRMGYTLTGHRNGPAPAEATGLEVDKLDPDAVRRYADTYLGAFAGAVGADAMGARGITALLSDSIESGPQNWTPAFPRRFRDARGYDLTPWLPALAGHVVGSAVASDRFLWDVRRTIADLVATAHYGTLAAAAHRRGLTYYAEALEDHRPQLGDDLAMRAQADVPMAAMWTIPPGGAPRQTFFADIEGAASVAHVMGKPVVAAESFTAFGAPWAFAPQDLKATADLEFALGVNRIVIHTSPHQPFTDGRAPGMALAPFLGQYFSRTESWAEMARPWTDYLARSAFLLQQGRHVADIAYFVGEDAPVTGLYGDRAVDLPAGRPFDFIDAATLADDLSVEADGTLRTRGGARYAMLVLGGSSGLMTRRVLDRVAALARAGATIVGAPPAASPSLADDAAAFRRAVAALWHADGRRPFARLDDAIAARRLARDWSVTGASDADVAVIHRTLDDGEIWFVSNRSGRPIAGSLSLRAAGYAPERWDAETGGMAAVSYRTDGTRTQVPLALDGGDACFFVLRRHSRATQVALPTPRRHMLATLDGGWTLGFDGDAKPSDRSLGTLSSWSDSDDPALRYYSGTGSYRRPLAVPAAWLRGGRTITLALGRVHDVAEVRVNGRLAGTVWRAPWRLDVTRLLRAGTNTVEIRVANLWVNRLIGDAQPGATRRAFSLGATYAPDAPLRPSGLLGPVTLSAEDGAPAIGVAETEQSAAAPAVRRARRIGK